MGHLNSLFAPRGGNLNKPIFKSSNARGVDVEAQHRDEIIPGRTHFCSKSCKRLQVNDQTPG